MYDPHFVTDYDKSIMFFLRNEVIEHDHLVHPKLGCLIESKEGISLGFNSMKSHPLQARFSKNKDSIFKHAEIDAIIRHIRSYKEESLMNSTMYIFRVKKKKKFSLEWIDGLAHPCTGCMGAIMFYDISRIVYSTNNPAEFKVLSLETP